MKAAVKSASPKSTKRGLGKGLSALMSDSYSQAGTEASPEAARSPLTMPLGSIRPGKFQPRGHFDESALQELAASIRKNGIMQPILVRPHGGGYEIVAGERRWRAARLAGLAEIPVTIREVSDTQALELALVENVQRADLHPIEEARAYRRLMAEFDYTQEEVAQAVDKSRSQVANMLRLLDLPEEVLALVASGRLSVGHARALLGCAASTNLAHDVVGKGLSVRQTERLVRQYNDTTLGERKARKTRAAGSATGETGNVVPLHVPGASQASGRAKDPDIIALEETLSENLGLKVSISDRGQSGEITVAYESLEQLDEILRRLGGSI